MVLSKTDSSLRQSISGNGMTLDEVAENEKKSEKLLPPPILLVPPGFRVEDLVTRVEKAYKLDYYHNYFNAPIAETDQTEHALNLMDEGLDFILEHKYRAASDMFSLCLVLENNYFYNYLLALVRVKFGDFYQALELLEKALSQIRARQRINSNLLIVSQKISFTENFYTLYIIALLQNDKVNYVQNIIDFVLNQEIVQSPTLLLNMIKQLLKKEQTNIAMQLFDLTRKAINHINDSKLKSYYLDELLKLEKKMKRNI